MCTFLHCGCFGPEEAAVRLGAVAGLLGKRSADCMLRSCPRGLGFKLLGQAMPLIKSGAQAGLLSPSSLGHVHAGSTGFMRQTWQEGLSLFAAAPCQSRVGCWAMVACAMHSLAWICIVPANLGPAAVASGPPKTRRVVHPGLTELSMLQVKNMQPFLPRIVIVSQQPGKPTQLAKVSHASSLAQLLAGF